MKAYNIEYDGDARFDFNQIFNWYANINPQLAIRFENEIEKTEHLLTKHPRIAQAINPNTRQRPISQPFPYNIIYQLNETEKTIIILAIRHQKREPITDN